jgi:hypothetical protein
MVNNYRPDSIEAEKTLTAKFREVTAKIAKEEPIFKFFFASFAAVLRALRG